MRQQRFSNTKTPIFLTCPESLNTIRFKRNFLFKINFSEPVSFKRSGFSKNIRLCRTVLFRIFEIIYYAYTLFIQKFLRYFALKNAGYQFRRCSSPSSELSCTTSISDVRKNLTKNDLFCLILL